MTRPRVVSLIASATEMICALGVEDRLVGRSHECDFPESVRRLPVCTAPQFDVAGSSRQIDNRVKATLQTGASVYQVDSELLRALRPDVVVTQAQCEVCAVSARDVEAALSSGWTGAKPQIVSLMPNTLADLWTDIAAVSRALGVPTHATELIARLRTRMGEIAARSGSLAERPSIACLEWIDPLMTAGNWMPELVEMAGGRDLFGRAGKHAPRTSWASLREADPEIIVSMPCGWDMERSRPEMGALTAHPQWPALRAVRTGRVYLADGNQFFNRPGPRLVESLEILAEILHPAAFHFGHEGTGWQRL